MIYSTNWIERLNRDYKRTFLPRLGLLTQRHPRGQLGIGGELLDQD